MEVKNDFTDLTDEVHEIDLFPEPDKKVCVDDEGYIDVQGIKVPYFRDKFNSLRKYETIHDVPCPSGMGSDVGNYHHINEWVFNHLPLKEDEKKEILQDLRKEQLINKRSEEVQDLSKEEFEKAKKDRKEKRKTRNRRSVKDDSLSQKS